MLRRRCEHGRAMLIHDNGLWLPTNHSAAVIAGKFGVPLVVSTRGMLEPWALKHRAWKKQIAWWLYQRNDLRTARVLHATAPHEAESLRRLGLRQPIAVIPNGVDLPPFLHRSQVPASPHVALFLGRIHPVKGLLELVDAWRIVRPSGWTMIIAGPDEGGHRAVVEERIRRAGVESDFQLSAPWRAKTRLPVSARRSVHPAEFHGELRCCGRRGPRHWCTGDHHQGYALGGP